MSNITDASIREDIIQLFKLFRQLRDDFTTMHDRYMFAEEEHARIVHEASQFEHPLRLRIDKLEKVLTFFQKRVEEHFKEEVCDDTTGNGSQDGA